MKKHEKTQKTDTSRPLARVMARELSAEEIERVAGSGPHPYSPCGHEPIQTGDWDDLH